MQTTFRARIVDAGHEKIRNLYYPVMRRLLLSAIAAAAVATSASAQLRSIPDDAQRGTIRHLQDMVVEVDGKPQRLSPGAQIRDPDNRLVVPASVAPGTIVRYRVDAEGLIHQVWILSPGELSEREKR